MEEFINVMVIISRTCRRVNIVTSLGICFEGVEAEASFMTLCPMNLLRSSYLETLRIDTIINWDEKHVRKFPSALLEDSSTYIELSYIYFAFRHKAIQYSSSSRFLPRKSLILLRLECTQKDSTISMAAARWTARSIAPEEFSKNFEGVSHKFDIYCYAMAVLEIVGG